MPAKNTIVSIARLETTKHAAVLFDYVVPIFVDDAPSQLFPPGFHNWSPVSPTAALESAQEMSGSNLVSVPISDGRNIRLTDEKGDPDIDALELVNEFVFLNNKDLQKKLYSEMLAAKIDRAPIITSGGSLKPVVRPENLEDVTIILANMPLINVNDSSWEQIMELREDKLSLNRLRLHLASKYIDLPTEQVEAGLLSDLENYKQAADKHGFTLKSGLLEATIEAKILLGSIGGGAFLGSLLGEGHMTAGAIAGFSLEVAKISISAAKGLYDVRQLKNNHPLSYVLKVQESSKY